MRHNKTKLQPWVSGWLGGGQLKRASEPALREAHGRVCVATQQSLGQQVRQQPQRPDHKAQHDRVRHWYLPALPVQEDPPAPVGSRTVG